MKTALFILFLLVSAPVFSAGKCKDGDTLCLHEDYKVMRVVTFDLVLADCPSLEKLRREEAAKIRKEALKATFNSPEWNALVAQMSGIEGRCPDRKKSATIFTQK